MQKLPGYLFTLALCAFWFQTQSLPHFAQINNSPGAAIKSKDVVKPTATKETAKSAFALAKFENEILVEINNLRRNPGSYIPYLEEQRKHYDGNTLKLPNQTPIVTAEGTAAVDDAIAYLKQIASSGEVGASRGLTRAADGHLRDMMQNNFSGHKGSNGSSPGSRVQIYGQWNGEVRELISYFAPTARQIVINYLIDDGNKKRGHRIGLLNGNLKYVGLATGDSKKFGKICVTVLAQDFTEQ